MAQTDTSTEPHAQRWDLQRAALCRAVLPVWERQLTTALEQSVKSVSQMLQAFSEIGPVLDKLAVGNARMPPVDNIQANIEQMYVGFQYQDRLSQALSLLQTDISRMMEALTIDPQTPDALQSAPWLGRLESEYVMAEQHAGCVPHQNSQHGPTFF